MCGSRAKDPKFVRNSLPQDLFVKSISWLSAHPRQSVPGHQVQNRPHYPPHLLITVKARIPKGLRENRFLWGQQQVKSAPCPLLSGTGNHQSLPPELPWNRFSMLA
ncbi:hypothetical protein ElyMa_000744100 [Elysia marginata]|uniref:Uncharacterized protein n=1 Tax=Elysia marginata TaxID=1093978 RepID=A0AAV4GP61_9GAST|nr:hypothetical protein ElyMa_000744100 [Elysia marginata]